MGKYRDYISMAIGLLLLGLVTFFMSKSEFASKEMFYFVILAFSLGLLSFLIIGKITGEGKMLGVNIKSFSGGFAIFIIVILLFLVKQHETPEEPDPNIEIFKTENPQDTTVWSVADGTFKWFNAPFGYASGKQHALTKFEWFKKPGFQIEIKMFISNDTLQNNDLFYPRLKNLRQFLFHMKELSAENGNIVSLENRMDVRVVKCVNIPTISFFTTNKSLKNKPYSILYIFHGGSPFRPVRCLTSYSKDLNITLTEEFNKGWEDNETTYKLSLEKLLDENIPLEEQSLDFFK